MAPAMALSHPAMSGSIWRMTLAGLTACLVGIGLARFAYTPLLPALIAAGWFTPGDAAYLGAANLAGYLAGALLAGRLAAAAGTAVSLRAMMALAAASFFASVAPLSFAWFFCWRLASGIAGGALMALAAPSILPHVPAPRRGLAAGFIFTGVGLGIAASGTLVPLLLRSGLAATWSGLGAVALVLTALSWRAWPSDAPAPKAAPPPTRHPPALRALHAEYALNAAGLVPHMVFLVDFVARGLQRGLAAGARDWVVFGLGALAGPVLAGRLADRIGFAPALRLALLIQTLAVGLVTLSPHPAAVTLSSLLVGAFVPGIVPLVLGRVQALTSRTPQAAQSAWSIATAAFALGQAAAAYLFSFLFARSGDYALLFALGTAALALALVIDLAASRRHAATA